MDDKLISALKQRYNLPVTTDGLQLLKDEVDNVSVDSLYAEFLNTDIKGVADKALPEQLGSTASLKLDKTYVLQVAQFSNLSAPSYDQDNKAFPRCLRVRLTDGHQRVTAVENEPLSIDKRALLPGTKVAVSNCAVVNGTLLLSPGSLKILGGRVERLAEAFEANENVEKLRKLGLKVEKESDGGPPPFEVILVKKNPQPVSKSSRTEVQSRESGSKQASSQSGDTSAARSENNRREPSTKQTRTKDGTPRQIVAPPERDIRSAKVAEKGSRPSRGSERPSSATNRKAGEKKSVENKNERGRSDRPRSAHPQAARPTAVEGHRTGTERPSTAASSRQTDKQNVQLPERPKPEMRADAPVYRPPSSRDSTATSQGGKRSFRINRDHLVESATAEVGQMKLESSEKQREGGGKGQDRGRGRGRGRGGGGGRGRGRGKE